MSENRKLIGNKIKNLLADMGKTQDWLADETGVTKGYLSELINGHPKKRWHWDQLEAVAKALKVRVRDLMPADEWEDVQLERLRQLDADRRKTFESLLLQMSKK